MYEELDKLVEERCRIPVSASFAVGGLRRASSVIKLAKDLDVKEEEKCDVGCCACSKQELKNKAINAVIKEEVNVSFNVLKSGLEEEVPVSPYQQVSSELNQAIKDYSVEPSREGAELVERLKKEVKEESKKSKESRGQNQDKKDKTINFLRTQLQAEREGRAVGKTYENTLAKQAMEAEDLVEEKEEALMARANEIEEKERERQNDNALQTMKQETATKLKNIYNEIKKTLSSDDRIILSNTNIQLGGLKGVEKKEAIIENIMTALELKNEKIDSYIEVKTVVNDVQAYLNASEVREVDETLDELVTEVVDDVAEEFE